MTRMPASTESKRMADGTASNQVVAGVDEMLADAMSWLLARDEKEIEDVDGPPPLLATSQDEADEEGEEELGPGGWELGVPPELRSSGTAPRGGARTKQQSAHVRMNKCSIGRRGARTRRRRAGPWQKSLPPDSRDRGEPPAMTAVQRLLEAVADEFARPGSRVEVELHVKTCEISAPPRTTRNETEIRK